jgi:hypothetical protein
VAGVDWRAVLPPDAPLPPASYQASCEAFLDGLREVLGPLLAGIYLYGAVTFPRPEGWSLDVDFHTLLASVPTDGQRQALGELHRRVTASGAHLDGHHLLLADAGGARPPASVTGPVDDAWALHRAHIRAGRVAVLHGADPRGVLVAPSWPELLEGLRTELHYVAAHPEHTAFGVLNACRVVWSLEHEDVVVSKWEAARWGAAAQPGWKRPLAAAVRAYTGRAGPADEAVLSEGRATLLAAAEAAFTG